MLKITFEQGVNRAIIGKGILTLFCFLRVFYLLKPQKMASISARIREVFKNLKSDAVPRPPRPSKAEKVNEVTEEDLLNEENVDPDFDPEGINIDVEDIINGGIPKSKDKKKSAKSKEKNAKGNIIKVQANGNVINIVDSTDFHWGHVFVSHCAPSQPQNPSHCQPDTDIKIDNNITLLLEATVKPNHEYIDFISKNLGKNWHSFFRKLGYTQGRIETFEIDEAKNGVSEARYKLLLDWVRNDKDGSLGCLSKLLWEEGERQVVKELSLIYKKNL